MNFEKLMQKKKKAISPVLATVILIAITLIAAIAVAGFVFGLFGSFTSSARVSVTSATLIHGITAVTPTGTITALNTGTSNTNVNGISLTYGGQTCTPAIAGAPPGVPITAGAAPGTTMTVTAGGCTVASTSGEAFSGSLSLANGGQAPFTGNFQ
jgi:archaeal type IV pilus assembly protein PilA